eukprot:gb/GFBE01057560.1/.p1 GENE.gb/GFBE01057560.1/~~gb/GFBE01057560.1/.p1  ORF type:complete len:371 (+),score=58.64 gb/GFBE01057560.1/:1-1113(+)
MESSVPSGQKPVSWVTYTAALLIGWTVLLIGVLEHTMAITKSQHRSELDKLHSMFSQLNATMHSTIRSNRHGALLRDSWVEPASQHEAVPGVEQPAPERRLGSIYDSAAVGSATSATGCIQLADHATSNSLTMSSATCTGSQRCPPCFIATGLSQDSTLEIVACSTAKLTSTVSLSSAQLMDYTFVNADANNMLTIKSVTTAAGTAHTTYYLPPLMSVVAQCYGGGSNYMYFADKWASYGPVDFCPTGCGVQVPVTEDTTASGTAATYRGVDSAASSTVLATVTSSSSINGCTAASISGTAATVCTAIAASCTSTTNFCTDGSCTPAAGCTAVSGSCTGTVNAVVTNPTVSSTCTTAFLTSITSTAANVR